MNIRKRYRVVANLGERGDGSGKKIYRRAGSLYETDTGPVIFLNATVNPAGAVVRDGSILLSCYPEDEQQDSGSSNETF